MRCRVCGMRQVRALRVVAPGKPAAQRQREWRERNPELSRARSVQWKVEQRQKVSAYKAERGCEECGTTDSRVLDLHHRDGEEKVMAVSQMMARRSWAAVKVEMDKCRVLCANCHRIEHSSDEERAAAGQIAAAGFYRAS